MNIYLELTRKFNSGRGRAILAGGQAVVLHRLMVQQAQTLLPLVVPGGWP
jgi:hypothetical protein